MKFCMTPSTRKWAKDANSPDLDPDEFVRQYKHFIVNSSKMEVTPITGQRLRKCFHRMGIHTATRLDGGADLSCTALHRTPTSVGRLPSRNRLHRRLALRKAYTLAGSLAGRPLSEVPHAPISPEEANPLVRRTKFG